MEVHFTIEAKVMLWTVMVRTIIKNNEQQELIEDFAKKCYKIV